MTVIVFEPRNGELGEERGEIHLEVMACKEYLSKQMRDYGLPQDVALFSWINGLQRNAIVPDEFEERTRYMALELMGDASACSIVCKVCGKSISVDTIKRVVWDSSIDDVGIRMGASGVNVLCPRQHILLRICERLY